MISQDEKRRVYKQLNALRLEVPHGSVGGIKELARLGERQQRILGIYNLRDVRSVLDRICDLIEPEN